MIPKQGPVIAIDGPAGTGKSSATKSLAKRLGFVHVDTGALYRSIALLTLEKQRHPEQQSPRQTPEKIQDSALADAATEVARSIHLEFKREPTLKPSNRIFANGRDVTDFIRTPEVSMAASQISGIPEVRAIQLGLQRRLGCQGHTILEGRDIGTVVFPDADIKFFLNASPDERAKRRLLDLQKMNQPNLPSFEDLKKQIIKRDLMDSTRAVAPLKKAEDAIEIDTGLMTLTEVITTMENIVRDKLVLPMENAK